MGNAHGGIKRKEIEALGLDPEAIIDFSISINPDPLPDSVKHAILSAPLDRYPDPLSSRLCQGLSELLEINENRILPVNGTSQAVYLIAHSLADAGGKIVISGPTYGEYEDASRLTSGEIVQIDVTIDDGFYPNMDLLLKNIEIHKPEILWVCNPNNPTGVMLSEDDFCRLQKSCLRWGTVLVLDEAYRQFVKKERLYDTFLPGVVNLRSMTKDFSLPGLRLGYIQADSATIHKIKQWQPIWSVSTPAQRAGTACLNELDYFEKSWEKTRILRDRFIQKMEDSGFRTFPSDANFFLFHLPDVTRVRDDLLKEGIMIRDCTSFGLTDIARVGVRTEEDNNCLVRILGEFKKR